MKTIEVTDVVYDTLGNIREDTESISDVIRRLLLFRLDPQYRR